MLIEVDDDVRRNCKTSRSTGVADGRQSIILSLSIQCRSNLGNHFIYDARQNNLVPNVALTDDKCCHSRCGGTVEHGGKDIDARHFCRKNLQKFRIVKWEMEKMTTAIIDV